MAMGDTQTWEANFAKWKIVHIPNKGIASDTRGSLWVTILWKTVSERRIVTPAN